MTNLVLTIKQILNEATIARERNILQNKRGELERIRENQRELERDNS